MTALKGIESSLIGELEDLREELKEKTENERIEYIHEIVDGNIPVYTYDLLEVAQDELWLAVEEPELLAFGGKSTAVSAIAGNLYQHLNEKAHEWLVSLEKTEV